MRIYIAGKMAGLPDKGRDMFFLAEGRLKGEGNTVINPSMLPDNLPPHSYMPICMAMIDAADAVFLLPNWKDSLGAKLEKAYAEYQGKEIIYAE